MIVDYILGFKLNKKFGHSKATEEKIQFLEQNNQVSHLRIFSHDQFKTNKRMVGVILQDLHYAIHLLKGNRPDVIQIRGEYYFLILILAKIFKIPVIREIHSDTFEELILHYPERANQLKYRIINIFRNIILNGSTGVIFNHPDLEKHFRKKYLKGKVKSTSVYNGTDTENFVPFEEDEVKKTRAELGLKQELKYLLFIGSVSKWHGVDILIKSFGSILDDPTLADYRVLIVGGINPTYIDYLKSIGHKNIEFVGLVDKSIAVKYMNISHFCLLPVNNIRVSPGSPLKLYDYCSCGKYVLTQEKVTGYSDILDKYGIGGTCDFSDPQSIIDALLRIENNNLINKKQASKTRSVAIENFSWHDVVGNWVEFYKRCLEHV